MAKKKKGYKEPQAEANLTPMIDVTFLLIMFFMIVSDLAALNLEQLQLPKAPACNTEQKDRLRDQKTLIINVLQDGTIRITGITLRKKGKTDELTPYLRRFVLINTGIEQPKGGQPKPVENVMIYVRADHLAKFEAVHKVMDSLQKTGLYKINLGALKEELTQ